MDDAIADYRAALAAHAPLESPRIFTCPIDADALAAVERDLVGHRTLENGDGRVAAALAYYTRPSSELLSFAATHASTFLDEELNRLPRFSWPEAEKTVFALIDRSSQSDLANMVPGSEWLIEICSVLTRANSEAIFDVIGTQKDQSNVALAYVLITFVPTSLRKDVIRRLVSEDNLFRRVAALGLTFEWIVAAIAGQRALDGELVETFLGAHTSWRNKAFGELLERIVHWIETRRLSGTRYPVAIDTFNGLVAALMGAVTIAPRDVEAVIEFADSRGACVLAAMAVQIQEPGKVSPSIAAAVKRGGPALLRRLFASTMSLTEEEAQEEVLDLQPVLRPLITAFDRLGIEAELLQELYYGLSVDRYSRDHRPSFWMRDRPRALALLAVGGAVARDLKDDNLMGVVEELTKLSKAQPRVRMPIMALNFNGLLDGLTFDIPDC